MPQVTGVRLRYSKTLWFSPGDTKPVEGDIVIVSTERGEELGLVKHEPIEVEESSLPAELKPVLRIVTEKDMDHALDLSEKEKAAMTVFRELVEKSKLDMKPVDVEYVFGGDKIVFYFSAEGRVDFRSLVKDLASRFHLRIDMRQIGVRDEARAVGGIGHCGEMLCCTRMGGEFAPVSIKMAKDQGLPLNPLKISGLCGRLMCCLRYEVEAYRDFNARAPRKNALIDTPQGEGKVIDRDAIREIITLRIQNSDGPDDRIPVPLEKFSCCKDKGASECGCPCSISKEDFEQVTNTVDNDTDDFLMADIVYKKSSTQEVPSPAKPVEKTEEQKDSKDESKGRANKRRRGSRRGGAGRAEKPSPEGTSEKAPKQKPSGSSSRSGRSGGNRAKPSSGSAGATKTAETSSGPKTGSTPSDGKPPKVQPGERIPRRRNR